MKNNDNINPFSSGKKLFLFFIIFGIALVLAAILAQIVLFLGLGDSLLEFSSNPKKFPNKRSVMLLAQGVTAIITFIGGTFLFQKVIKEKKITDLLKLPTEESITLFGITLLLAFTVMPVVGIIYQWNMNIELPAFLSDFEKWAKNTEENAKVMTEYMVNVSNITEMILGFIVVALLAGLGEELAFRGVLQPILIKITKNHHTGIIITGFLFSAIHFQLYGLFPRMLLGVLFGYLYYWSKNLWIPIFAHFVNNGITLTAEILKNKDIINSSFDEEIAISYGLIIPSLLASIALIYLFRRTLTSKNSSNWKCIYESPNSYKIQIIKDLLENASLHPVIMNGKDTPYGIGSIQILVKPEEVLQSKKIIDEGEIDKME